MSYEYEIAPASPFQEKYLNNNSRFMIVGGAMGCVDMDTEYLGEHGWRKISQYQGEKIYIHDPLTNEIKTEYPEHHVEMGELLYHFRSEHIDQVLSPSHKSIYYKYPSSKPTITDTMTLIERYNNNQDVVGWMKGYDGVSVKNIEFAGYTITEYIPKDKKQYCFRTSTGAWVARRNGKPFITGNSSKSYIGLMRHLRYIHDPNYVGVIVRKNMKAIKAAGGLWDEAVGLFKKVDPNIRTTLEPRRIHFSNGATIEFMHYENDKARDNFQGLNV